MNLEVSSASKHMQNIKDAPSSVTVISAREIRAYGYRTLADVLRSVRGFYVTYDRNYSYIGVRGFAPPGDYNSRILLLIDGARVNDNVYYQTPIGTELPLDLDAVEKIEIVRGPSSSLYGSNAFLALVNLVTKTSLDLTHAQVSTEADSFRGTREHIVVSEALPYDIDMLLAGSIYYSAGQHRLFFPEFNSPLTNHGFAVDNDDDAAKNILLKLSHRDFGLEAIFGTREKGIPTASFGTVFNDPRSRTTDSYETVALTYDHSLDETTSISGRASYNRYSYTGRYAYADGPGILVDRDTSRGDWWGFEGQLQRNLGKRNSLTCGAELRNNVLQDQSDYDPDVAVPYFRMHNTSALWAGFVQDELRLSRILLLSAGVRYDHYTAFGGTTNPRIALLVEPHSGTTLKLMYGQAFRPPNVFEMYYEYPGSQEANTKLRPETIETYEAAVDQYIGSHLELTASAYYYTLGGLIKETTDTNGLLTYRNQAGADAKGLEFEAHGRWGNGIETRATYSLQQSRDASTGSTLSNSPRHLASLQAMGPVFTHSVIAGPELQFVSRRVTPSGLPVSSATLFNLTMSAKPIGKHWDFSASAYNVFDRQHSDPVGPEQQVSVVRQDGRSFRVKVAYSF